MTPRLSIIAASIRRVISALVSTASDYYWDNVVLAMKMDTGVDPEWANTVLAMHMNDADPYWGSTVLAMHMDGTNTEQVFTDLKGKSVTVGGGTNTRTATKQFGTASAYFDGVGDNLTIGSSADFYFPGDFTIECWINCNIGATETILGNWEVGASYPFKLDRNSSSAIQFWMNGGTAATGPGTAQNVWSHVAVVRNSGSVVVYVDGVGGTPVSYATAIGPSGGFPVYIGSYNSSASPSLNAYVDDLRITKGVARYTANFTRPTLPFLDGASLADLKSHSITSVGTPSLSAAQSKFGGKSALFNGTTDYLTIPTSTDFGFGTGDFTVECWVKTAVSGTVLDLRSVSGDLGLFAINGGFISLWNGSTHLQGFTNVTTDAWVHLAWVRSAGVVSMFVNGVLDGVSATPATFGTTRPVRIGADIASANFFSGYIDDLRVSKVARYAVEFTPSAVPFLDGTAVPFLEEKGKAVTVVGGATTSTATKKYGTGSGYFNNDTYLTLLDSADFTFGSSDFTIEAWVNVDNVTSLKGVAGQRSNSSSMGWSLQVDSAAAKFDYSTSGSLTDTVTNSQALSAGSWWHLAVVRHGPSLVLFVNGAAGTPVNIGTDSIYDASLPLWVGSMNQLSPSTFDMIGYIDDLRITKGVARYISNFTPPTESIATNKKTYIDPHWDKVVLGMHMNGIDNGTTFTDVKGKTVSVFGNTATKTAFKKFGTASAYFDGTGDYLTVPNSADFAFGSGDFTVECWINPSSIPTTTSDYRFIVSRDSVGATRGWSLTMMESTGFVSFAVFGDNASPFIALTDTSAPPEGQWTHFAATRSGSNTYLHRNGVLVASQTGISGTGQDSGVYLLIGTNNQSGSPVVNGSWEFYGYIDDLRITKGVARYTANFQPVQLPFPNS